MSRRVPYEEAVPRVLAAARRVAADLGIDPTTLTRDVYDANRERGVEPSTQMVVTVGGWGAVRSMLRGEAPDVPPPGSENHINPIPQGMTLKGVSTYHRADGVIAGQWTIARRQHETREEVFARLLEELPPKIPVREETIPEPDVASSDDMLAVYPIGDPHLGMLAWAPETLEADYDLSIGSALLRGAVDELTANSPPASQALIVNLGDFFHSDSDEHRTRRSGNVLDVDSRWAKILSVGLDVMIHLVDSALRSHSRVRIINEIGNHDDQSAIMLSIALDRHYSLEPRVEVDLSPARYHYHRFGRCVIGTTHYPQKAADLESIMAHDCRAEWSETEHRYWYVGHVHHTTKKERRNCVVESFRTLAPSDAWASGEGYRSGRDMCRIAIHRDFGEIARSVVSAAYLERRARDVQGLPDPEDS